MDLNRCRAALITHLRIFAAMNIRECVTPYSIQSPWALRTDARFRGSFYKPRYVRGLCERSCYEQRRESISSGIRARPLVPLTAGQFMVRDWPFLCARSGFLTEVDRSLARQVCMTIIESGRLSKCLLPVAAMARLSLTATRVVTIEISLRYVLRPRLIPQLMRRVHPALA